MHFNPSTNSIKKLFFDFLEFETSYHALYQLLTFHTSGLANLKNKFIRTKCRFFLHSAVFFLASRELFAQIETAMSVNLFHPNPIRLCQEIEPNATSGSNSTNEINRRSFLKRTGGATVATLVAWNMATRADAVSMINDASANSADWGKRILICYQDPRALDPLAFINKTTNDDRYPHSSTNPRSWENVPQIDCSVGMDLKNASRTVLDWWGQGVTYHLLHWLEFKNVILQGHYVPASETYSSDIRSWAAVVEGRWVYKKCTGSVIPNDAVRCTANGGLTSEYWIKAAYMRRVVLLASIAVRGLVRGLSPDPLVEVNMNGKPQRPWLPIKFRNTSLDQNPIEVGYLQLSNMFEPLSNPQGGEKFRSVAAIIPKMSLVDQTLGVQRSDSISLELANGSTKLGVNRNETNSIESRYKTNFPPMLIEHQLVWGHKTMTTASEVNVGSSNLLNIPNPVQILPGISLMKKDDDTDDGNNFYEIEHLKSEAVDKAIYSGVWYAEQ